MCVNSRVLGWEVGGVARWLLHQAVWNRFLSPAGLSLCKQHVNAIQFSFSPVTPRLSYTRKKERQERRGPSVTLKKQSNSKKQTCDHIWTCDFMRFLFHFSTLPIQGLCSVSEPAHTSLWKRLRGCRFARPLGARGGEGGRVGGEGGLVLAQLSQYSRGPPSRTNTATRAAVPLFCRLLISVVTNRSAP